MGREWHYLVHVTSDEKMKHPNDMADALVNQFEPVTGAYVTDDEDYKEDEYVEAEGEIEDDEWDDPGWP